jgi:hypothetical protein
MSPAGTPLANRHRRSSFAAIAGVLIVVLFLGSSLPSTGASPGSLPSPPVPAATVGVGALSIATLPAGAPPAPGGSNLTAEWRELNASSGPMDRDMAALAYDPLFRADLLFGGYSPDGSAPLGGLALNDTWELINDSWVNLTARLGTGPAGRWGARMAWDPSDSALILFGGRNFTQFFNDTWQLNASGWAPIPTTSAPSPRNLFQSTYDAGDAYLLLYGGWTKNLSGSYSGLGQTLGDTWAFTGAGWTNLTASAGIAPGPRSDGSLVYLQNSSTTLLYGGSTQAAANGTCSPTSAQYTYRAGSGWTLYNVSLYLPSVFGLASASLNLSTEGFYFGGATSASGCPGTAGTWADTSTGWYNLTSVSSTNPMARAEAAMTYDATTAQVVLFGGVAAGSNYLGDTWVWGPFGGSGSNGSSGGNGTGRGNATGLQPGWNLLTNLSQSPSLRDMASMAYDPALGEVVLFGGYYPSIMPLGDTWTFAHDQWTDLALNQTAAPAPRWGARMIWDPASQQLVLFGGRNLTQFFNDTWTFSASGWSRVPTSHAPSPRGFFEFTYLSAGYALLYGGGTGNVPAGSGSAWRIQTDTWEYSAGAWTNVTAAVSGAPAPTIDAAMAYDPVAGLALRVGGSSTGHPNGACTPIDNETTFNAGSWTPVSGGSSPVPALAGESMVWDNRTAALFLFGGTVPGGGACPGINETWEWSNGTWTNQTGYGNASPSGRSESTLAYDAADDQVVLFGGVSTTQGYIGDTWVWVGPTPGGNRSGGNGSTDGNGSGGEVPIAAGESESTSEGVGPLAVEFSVTPTGGTAPYRYTWTFGDGSSLIGAASVQHEYLTAGSFDPTVLITDAAGHSLLQRFPTVAVLPTTQGQWVPPATTGGPSLGSYLGLIALGIVAGAVASGLVLGAVLRARRLQEEGEELVRRPGPGEPR